MFLSSHKCSTDSCLWVNIFMFYHLSYTYDECINIEIETRGQCKNDNWHIMRNGLLTASKFHQICTSTNVKKTAGAILKPGLIQW